MKTTVRQFISAFALFSLTAGAAAANDAKSENVNAVHTIRIEAKTQNYAEDYGALRSVSVEYKHAFETQHMALIVSPTVGQRKAGSLTWTSIGGSAALYAPLAPRLASRTEVFVSEGKPVFAKLDLTQELSYEIGNGFVLTSSGRWAKYADESNVAIVSMGARKYFRGGSIAYRAGWTKPSAQDAFVSHLVNFNIDDARGAGKTQFWLSIGASTTMRSQLANNFSKSDYGAVVRRTQPLTSDLEVLLTAGVSSYARPSGRITATTVGLGLQLKLR